jgi:hypothetical protein
VFSSGAFSANIEGGACIIKQKNKTTALAVQLLPKNDLAGPKKSLATAVENAASCNVHVFQRDADLKKVGTTSSEESTDVVRRHGRQSAVTLYGSRILRQSS